jgi:hypothetical protein
MALIPAKGPTHLILLDEMATAIMICPARAALVEFVMGKSGNGAGFPQNLLSLSVSFHHYSILAFNAYAFDDT